MTKRLNFYSLFIEIKIKHLGKHIKRDLKKKRYSIYEEITYSDDDVEPQFVDILHVGVGGGTIGVELHLGVRLLQHELQHQAKRKHVYLACQRKVLRLVLEDAGVATLQESTAHLGGHVL